MLCFYIGNMIIDMVYCIRYNRYKYIEVIEGGMHMKGQTYIILAVVFAVIIAIFAVINVDPVKVDYLFGSGQAPLILVILFSVLMGVIITASVGVLRVIRLQKQLKSANSQINTLKAQEKTAVDEEIVSSETTDLDENDETVK